MLTVRLLFVLFIALCLPASAKELNGLCIGVTDGDTITVLAAHEDNRKEQHKIRLYGIDAPERKQAYGEKSKQYLSQLVFGKEVRVDWFSKDKYGRILGKVYLDDLYINLHMVKTGYAWHYSRFCGEDIFILAEQDACNQKLGLWQDSSPVSPWNFRKKKKG